MTANFMIYGATGYTGTLTAEEAVKRGHHPILAGRSADKLEPLADRLGLDWIAVSLENPDGLRRALEEVELVLNDAGPFYFTAKPMQDTAEDTATHYLDITGEYPIFEMTFKRDAHLREKGIAFIPGVGFDVVPTDCLAKYVADQLPGAISLDIALTSLAGMSAGTALTGVMGMRSGSYHGIVRRDGELIPYPLGHGGHWVQFDHARRYVMPIPWGDLSTAYRSTGIPNITTSMSMKPGMARIMKLGSGLLTSLMRIKPLNKAVANYIKKNITGPDEQQRQTARSHIYAKATDADGHSVEAWLDTVEAYRLTAEASIMAVERVLAGGITGALTPAQAFGPDFVLDIPGTIRYDTV